MHNIRDYGALLDGVTVDDAAIHLAVAAMVPGDTLLIPPGDCRIQNVVLDVPDESTIQCEGRFVTATGIPGPAVQIGRTDAIRFRLSVRGLKVICDGLDWSPGRVGVQVVNVYESVLDIRQVQRFNTNLLLWGTDSKGCVYNEIHLGRLVDGKTSLRLTSDAGGWCNENTFYGGRIDFNSSLPDTTGCIGIVCEHNPINTVNNNRFFATSIEARAWGGIPAVHFEGRFNSLLFPRLEKIGPVIFGANSTNCVLMFGYGLNIAFEDYGLYNKAITNGLLQWSASIAAGLPVIQVRSNSSNQAHLFSALDTQGNERAWLNGDGVFSSNQYVYARTGIRFLTEDRGLFVGSGSPEGIVAAAPGSMFSNSQGGVNQTLWVKRTGTDAFGWYAVA